MSGDAGYSRESTDDLWGYERAEDTLPSTLSIRDRSSLQEKVYVLLHDAIISGELRPGQRLVEHRLADQLGVSRVPIREAIRKLEQEKLVAVSPRRAVVVRDIDPREVEETFIVRLTLEGAAARLAAARASEADIRRLEEILASMEEALTAGNKAGLAQSNYEFHDAIVAMSENRKLIELVDDLRNTIERFRRLYRDRVGHSEIRSREHYIILRAIADHDGERAEQLIRTHLEGSLSRLIRSLHGIDAEK